MIVMRVYRGLSEDDNIMYGILQLVHQKRNNNYQKNTTLLKSMTFAEKGGIEAYTH